MTAIAYFQQTSMGSPAISKYPGHSAACSFVQIVIQVSTEVKH